MTETVILAFIAAKLKGYKIKPILKDWPIYIIFVVSAVYIFIEAALFKGYTEIVKYAVIYRVLYTAAFFGVIFKYELYKSTFIAVVFAAVGSELNNFVIEANGGKMPVYPSLSYITGYVNPEYFDKVKDVHILGTSAVNYKFLTDFIDLGYCILSVGDIFISMFAFIILYTAIKHKSIN
ncbi:MAG: DUF5317 family protein [Solirubrobacterales bacterium]